MLKVLLAGCSGHMGRVVSALAEQREELTIVAGVDLAAAEGAPYPVYREYADVRESVDVVIDFSHPSGLEGLLDYCLTRKVPAVIATTGFADCQNDAIRQAAEEIPIFFTGNMSLGVNLLAALVTRAAEVLGDLADIEIIEMHHNQKIDAPSGTAGMLYNAAVAGRKAAMHPEYDRHNRRQKRPANEIGMHSVRGGTIVGEHQVIFAGKDEILTLSHSARSKEVFAVGALKAAAFLAGRAPGLYDMNQLVQC